MNAFVAQIDSLGIIGAAIGGRAAVQAAGRCTFGGVFELEMAQTSKRGNTGTMAVCHPQHNVHIVAAFCKDHGACFVLAAPVSAHKAVCLMPIGNIFNLLDALQSTDGTAVQQFLHLAEEGSIPQHMTHSNQLAHLLCACL